MTNTQIDLTGATLTSNRGNVRVFLLQELAVAMLAIPAERFVKKEAQGTVPEHFFTRAAKAAVHLRDGLVPAADGRIVGRVEVKVRVTPNQFGRGEVHYLSLNVFPANGTATHEVVLTKNAADLDGANWAVGPDQNWSCIATRPLASAAAAK